MDIIDSHPKPPCKCTNKNSEFICEKCIKLDHKGFEGLYHSETVKHDPSDFDRAHKRLKL